MTLEDRRHECFGYVVLMTARGKNISQDDSTSDPEPKIKQIEFIQDIVMTLIASENII